MAVTALGDLGVGGGIPLGWNWGGGGWIQIHFG